MKVIRIRRSDVAGRLAVLFTATSAVLALTSPAMAAPVDPRGVQTQMADEVAAKILASPAFLAKASGRKVKIVIGDVVNNSDDDGVRVDDISDEIRNQIVAAGTARLFAPGELDVDFIIAPALTSAYQLDSQGRRRRCFTLQLTLSTASGEYVAAHSAASCH